MHLNLGLSVLNNFSLKKKCLKTSRARTCCQDRNNQKRLQSQTLGNSVLF